MAGRHRAGRPPPSRNFSLTRIESAAEPFGRLTFSPHVFGFATGSPTTPGSPGCVRQTHTTAAQTPRPPPSPPRRPMTRRTARRRRSARLVLETLEARLAPALVPLTLADPAFYGTSANGASGGPSLSDDGKIV